MLEKVKKFYCLFKERNNLLIGIFILLLAISFVWVYLTSPVSNLEIPTSFEIESGSSLRDVSQSLMDAGIIKSRTILNAVIILGAGDEKVVSGEYLFEKAPTVFEVAKRITLGDFGIDVKEVRFPEGVTVEEIALIMESRFPYFEKNAFMQLASDSEGMLFPDTYFFLENVKAHEVYRVLTNTFEELSMYQEERK
jgi:cell division protein YceG involved in septum cleavage